SRSRASSAPPAAGIGGVAKPVAEIVEADDRDDDRERRGGQRPPRDPGQAARVRHHLTERGRRRGRAGTEEAEAPPRQDRPRKREARPHGDHAVDARQYVAEEHPAARETEHLPGAYEIGVPE